MGKKCNEILHHIREKTQDETISNENEERTRAVSNRPDQLGTNVGDITAKDGKDNDGKRKASSTSLQGDASNRSIAAALQCKRNALCLESTEDDEYLIKRKLTNLMNDL